ncbi:hypothetical protein FSP39_021332 [Pinctada imbricata]|uniref:Lipase n=1 Tax=Pinctada imbricata TaxID=66713 RepID=A0AA88XTT3_PINIB|nr:hypothetical protein FSP39_021332 [Pinctada imbricata]
MNILFESLFKKKNIYIRIVWFIPYYLQTQLITSKGYPCEEHEVVTEDGYILGVQRIPRGRNQPVTNKTRPVVLLQHGFMMCSSCWVENLANESLGFMLADAGMDVWMANSRGNTYSKKHKTLDPKKLEFWNFSFDEMAKYDLPATIDYVLQQTNQKQLYYVGHSQGTVIGFITFGWPEVASKVKTFFALAPYAYSSHMRSPIRYLSPLARDVKALYAFLGNGEFLSNTQINKFLGRDFCAQKQLDIICENVLFLVGGYDLKATNVSRIPVYVSEHPAGSSTQNLVHYAQEVLSGKFQMYDFGSKKENEKHYNQSTPPEYDPSKVEIPIALFTGGHDALADPADVKLLRPKLKNVVFEKNVEYWEHLDLVWALDAGKLAYSHIIDMINNSTLTDNVV